MKSSPAIFHPPAAAAQAGRSMLAMLALILGSASCFGQPFPIRLFCDQAARGANFPIDLNTGAAPQWVRGDDLEFDVALGQNGALYTNIQYLTNLTFQLFARQNDTNGPMMAATVYNTNFSSLTASNWNNGAGSHAIFLFTNGASSVNLGGAESQTYWLRIFGLSTNAPPKRITYLEGPVTIYDGPVTNLVNAYPPNIALVVDALANLINPTNFFAENSNLLNQAVNGTHGAGGNVVAGLGMAMATVGGSNVVSHPSETNQFTAFNATRFTAKMRAGERAKILLMGDSMSEAGYNFDSAGLMLGEKLRDWYGDAGQGGMAVFDVGFNASTFLRTPPCAFFSGPVLYTNDQARFEAAAASGPDDYYALGSGWAFPTNVYNSISLWWLQWPQGGTFNFGATNFNGSWGATQVPTAMLSSFSASTNVGFTNCPINSSNVQAYATGLTYTNFLIAAALENTNSGAEVFFWSKGGISLTNLYAFGKPLLTAIFSNIAPDLVIFNHKNNGGAASGANIPTDLSNLVSCLPPGTPCQFTITPVDSSGAPVTESIATNVIAYANANQYGLLDLNAAFPGYRWMVTNGYYLGDGIHPTKAGANAQALEMAREMGLLPKPAFDLLPYPISSLTDYGVPGQFSESNGVLFCCVASNAWKQVTDQSAAGTVTSVAVAADDAGVIASWSGSPDTSSGTLKPAFSSALQALNAGNGLGLTSLNASALVTGLVGLGLLPSSVLTNSWGSLGGQPLHLGPFAYGPAGSSEDAYTMLTLGETNGTTFWRVIKGADFGVLITLNSAYNGQHFADDTNKPSFALYFSSVFNEVAVRYAAPNWNNGKSSLGGIVWTTKKIIDTSGNSDFGLLALAQTWTALNTYSAGLSAAGLADTSLASAPLTGTDGSGNFISVNYNSVTNALNAQLHAFAAAISNAFQIGSTVLTNIAAKWAVAPDGTASFNTNAFGVGTNFDNYHVTTNLSTAAGFKLNAGERISDASGKLSLLDPTSTTISIDGSSPGDGLGYIAAAQFNGGSFSGNGSALTSLSASALSGTIPLAAMPSAILTNNNAAAVGLTNEAVTNLTAGFLNFGPSNNVNGVNFGAAGWWPDSGNFGLWQHEYDFLWWIGDASGAGSLEFYGDPTGSGSILFKNAPLTLETGASLKSGGGVTIIDSSGDVIGASVKDSGVASALLYADSTGLLKPVTIGSGVSFNSTSGTLTGAGGGSQTPWTSIIEGAGFSLSHAGDINFTNHLVGGQSCPSTNVVLGTGGTTPTWSTNTSHTDAAGEIWLTNQSVNVMYLTNFFSVNYTNIPVVIVTPVFTESITLAPTVGTAFMVKSKTTNYFVVEQLRGDNGNGAAFDYVVIGQ